MSEEKVETKKADAPVKGAEAPSKGSQKLYNKGKRPIQFMQEDGKIGEILPGKSVSVPKDEAKKLRKLYDHELANHGNEVDEKEALKTGALIKAAEARAKRAEASLEETEKARDEAQAMVIKLEDELKEVNDRLAAIEEMTEEDSAPKTKAKTNSKK